MLSMIEAVIVAVVVFIGASAIMRIRAARRIGGKASLALSVFVAVFFAATVLDAMGVDTALTLTAVTAVVAACWRETRRLTSASLENDDSETTD